MASPETPERRYDITILRDGTWLHEGTPIQRKRLRQLFASVLRCDESGQHWLETPVERGRVAVEDVAFVAVALEVTGAGAEQVLRFRTNLDEWAPLDASHGLSMRIPPGMETEAPYIIVRSGLEARVNRSVYYQLVEMAERHPTQDRGMELGVRSAGAYFPLGRIED